MELLETHDPEKKKLIESSNRHRQEIEKEIQAVSDRTQRIATNALIVGGALALAYFAFSTLSDGKKKKKKKIKSAAKGEEEEYEVQPAAPSLISQIGEQVITQATFLLSDIAKAKLSEYLQSRKEEIEANKESQHNY